MAKHEQEYDGGSMAKGGTVTLFYDDKPVGSGRVEATHPIIFSANYHFIDPNERWRVAMMRQ